MGGLRTFVEMIGLEKPTVNSEVEGTIELQRDQSPCHLLKEEQPMIVKCGALTMVVVEMQIAIEVNVVIEHYPSYLICLDSQRITAGMGPWPYYRIKCWLVKCWGSFNPTSTHFLALFCWSQNTKFSAFLWTIGLA